jgi:RNA polymerase sigma-70 factor (ECF subfamily)
VEKIDPEILVVQYYEALYRFALSLTRRESDAWDLTQQTNYLWAAKGHQLRDKSKVKTWLFSTLYHEFLSNRRKDTRYVHEEMNEELHAAPEYALESANKFESAVVQKALLRIDEKYRLAVTLFYLKEHSYREIAEVLGIPIGTVMSRISRGKQELRKVLVNSEEAITLKSEEKGTP